MDKLKKLPLATHEKINRWLLLLGMLVMVISMADLTVNFATILGSVLIVTGFVWQHLFRRCPHCGVPFPPRAPLPRHCPNCGKEVK